MRDSKLASPRRGNAVFLFGYDLFISFALGPAPRGTQSFASDVARKLRERDLTVFFSEDEMPPGSKLDDSLTNALRRSQALVVVLNAGTLKDPRWVRKEVQAFRAYHPRRPVIAVSVGGALSDPDLAAGAKEWLPYAENKWVDETEEAVATGLASPSLIERLILEPSIKRANVRWRWTARAAITLLALLGLGLAFATVIARWQTNEARRNVAELLEEHGRQSVEQEDFQAAWVYLSEAYQIRDVLKIGGDNASLRLLLANAATPFEGARFALRHRNRIFTVQFSARGDRALTASDDRSVKLWDTATGNLLATHTSDSFPLYGAILSPDGNYILTIEGKYEGGDGLNPGTHFLVAHLWGAAKDAVLEHYVLAVAKQVDEDPEYTFEPGFSSDSQSFALETTEEHGENTEVAIFDSATGQPKDPPSAGQITSAWFHTRATNAKHRFVAGFLSPNFVNVEVEQAFQNRVSTNETFADLSSDRHHAVSLGKDGATHVWDFASYSLVASMTGHQGGVVAARFSPDGSVIATIGRDNQVLLWKWAETKTPLETKLPFKVRQAWFNGAGDSILFLSDQNALALWNIQRRQLTWATNTASKTGTEQAVNADATRVLLINEKSAMELWDATSGKPLGPLGAGEVDDFAFSPNGDFVVTQDLRRQGDPAPTALFRVWNPKDGKEIPLAPLLTLGRSFDSMAVSSDGRLVFASVIEPEDMWISAAGNFNPIQLNRRHAGKLTSSVFSSDGLRLLTTGTDHVAMIWNTRDGKLIGELNGHGGSVSNGLFITGGKRVLTTSGDGTTKLWDAEKCGEIATYAGHVARTGLACNPDETFVVTAGPGGVSRIWETDTGRLLSTVKSPNGSIKTASFSPDGRRVLTTSESGTVEVWNVNLETRMPSEVAARVNRLIPARLVNGRLIRTN